MMHQALEDVMTKQNYSHHRHVVLYYAILLSMNLPGSLKITTLAVYGWKFGQEI